MTDDITKNFTKSLADTTQLSETFTRYMFAKSLQDFQPIIDTNGIALAFTLNTIDDPMSGIYPENGFVIYNPYDQGSYQAEHYANERPSSFST
jgi:hypothetical protein